MPLADILPRSIRGRLILLTVIAVIPAAAVAALLIFDSHQRERATVEDRLRDTAHTLSLVVDRQLGQSEALLKGLASSPYLAEGDFTAFHRQAESVVDHSGHWAVLADRDGRQLVNTYGAAGLPLPSVTGHAELLKALRTGKTEISNLYLSAASAEPVLAVSIPVFQNGQPAYALTLVMPPSTLSSVMIDQKLPAGWVAAVVDRESTVVARSSLAETFVGQRSAVDVGATVPGTAVTDIAMEGREFLVAPSRSPTSGWTVLVGAPEIQLLAPALRLLLLSFGICFALVALGVAISAWISRGVLRAVDTLVSAARAIGRGETPGPIATGMSETDQVAIALHGSALRLQGREAELKQLNDTLESRVTSATETLVQARKLEAIGRLTGGVAHDFNNLLTAIGVSLDLLERRAGDDRLKPLIRPARQAVDRGAKLTSQLLAFARKQRLQPEPVDVNAVVVAMGDLLASSLGGAVAIETELAAELKPAMADRTQLELIIMNLAINARDAMGAAGGAVRIRTGQVTITAAPSRTEHPSPGDYIAVSVIDTGTGISSDMLQRIFEPFFTTKPQGRGSGLGLPQVLGVVKQLGGGIRIDSEAGKGATVSIFLPIANAEARLDAVPETMDFGAVDKLMGLTVLLVDDDPEVRGATTALLEEIGCRVVATDSGAAALERLQGIDLALIDYAMPGMNGAELAEQLGQRRPGLPVLLMSGYVNAEALGSAWPGPVLQKPFSKEGLTRRLAEQLARAG